MPEATREGGWQLPQAGASWDRKVGEGKRGSQGQLRTLSGDPIHRLYPVGMSVDRKVASDVVLQNYHIPAGVSEAPQPLQQTPSPRDLLTPGATDPAPPHLSADIGQGATLLPGSKPLCV